MPSLDLSSPVREILVDYADLCGSSSGRMAWSISGSLR